MKASGNAFGLSGGPLLGALLFWLAGAGQGEQPRREQPAPAAAGPTRLYFGISACTQCHTRPAEQEPVLCRCTEATIWGTEDKHRDAFQVLRGERAKEMGELLKMNGPVWEEKSCVTCHGVYIEDARLRHRTFKAEDGVSCVACHGAYREWVALHGDVLERDNWRSYSRKLKEEKYGMRDLWDPANRTRLCASCHVGSAAEGKVVTHAMYGAGHPPLPGLEVATFSDAMPRHWQYVREKTPEVQKMLGADGAGFEQSRLVTVGAVVVLREALDLMANQAAQAVHEAGPKVIWPELAHFDCAACHHELQKPTWRPKRPAAGQPGWPPVQRWPAELAGLVLAELGGDDAVQFRQRWGGLEKALAAQPFGQPDDIARAARQVVTWLDQRLPPLSAKPFDRPAAIALLRRLTSLDPKDSLDYDSARQRLWAFQIIYQELAGAPGPTSAHDRAVRQLFQGLDTKWNLKLPAGRKMSIVDQLKEGLRRRDAYDAQELKEVFTQLSHLLPEK